MFFRTYVSQTPFISKNSGNTVCFRYFSGAGGFARTPVHREPAALSGLLPTAFFIGRACPRLDSPGFPGYNGHTMKGAVAVSDFLKRTWAEIDLDALQDNYRAIASSLTGNSRVMAVVKADAYGHGAGQTAAPSGRPEPLGSAYPIWTRPCRSGRPVSLNLS